jgi:FtsP/CotA-like multicopper oxidase with cupredoxin domain
VLNASNFRIFNLAREDGGPLVQIATESGLLPAPIERDAVVLGPAERAELLVDLTGMTSPVNVVSRLFADGATLPRSGATPADILQLRPVLAPSSAAPALPAALRPLPDWVARLDDVPTRVWAFSLGADPSGQTAWTVNGQPFDHERVDARPEIGTTETWMFVNAGPVAVSHYIHIHDVDWYVISRNFAPPQPWEAGLKETFRLDPGEGLVVGAKFTDHLGRFMIHCHMLEHEDHGMMATFEVVAPGDGDRPVSAAPVTEAGQAVVDRVRSTRQAAPLAFLAGLPVADADAPFCDLRL